MNVTQWNPKFLATLLTLFGVLGVAAGLSAGSVLYGFEAQNRHWVVVTELQPARAFAASRQILARGLEDPTQLFEFTSVRFLSTRSVGDRLILVADESIPPRYVEASQLDVSRPILRVGGVAFSWHGAFGFCCLAIAGFPLTRWWDFKDTKPEAWLMIATIGFLTFGAIAIIGSSESGKLAAATDSSSTFTFIVDRTEEISGSRFRGMMSGWFAFGHLAESAASGTVGISKKQYRSLAPGDELQVHRTSLAVPSFSKVETTEANGKPFWMFGQPFTWSVFIGILCCALPFVLLWLDWRERKAPRPRPTT